MPPGHQNTHNIPLLFSLLTVLILPLVTSLKIAGAFRVLEHTKLRLASEDYYTGTSPPQVLNGGVRDLGTKDIDVAGNAETQGLIALGSNKDIRIIYTAVQVPYRLAANGAVVTTLADLRGKRVGTQLESSAAYFVQTLLRTEGLRLGEDYDVVPGTFCNAAPCGAGTLPYMLASGAVDAVGYWEPTLQLAIDALGSQKKPVVVFQNASVYREIYNLYTTAEKLADAGLRADIVDYVRALHRTGAVFEDEPNSVIPRVAEAMGGMNEALVRAVWSVHDWRGGLPGDMLDVLVREDEHVAGLNGRERFSREELSSFIDSSVFEEAIASMGVSRQDTSVTEHGVC